MPDRIFAQLPPALLPWYELNKRELPWRSDRQPYHVWLSEIMLQQTRVEAVKGFYSRFLQALPTIADLAACPEDALYKLWEGLGYYSRVRNLQKAAQRVMKDHGGKFPTDYDAVRALPGIGDYTAGAICSICYDMSVAAVDGNVLRVVARLTDDHTPVDLPQYKKAVREELERIYPAQAGAFTQALMELGATVCGPNRKPDCEKCPCKEFCVGAKRGTAEKLPVRLPPKAKRTEEKTVFIFSCDGYYALQKRGSKGLLAGLWQFPDVPGKRDTENAIACAEEMGLTPRELYRETDRDHVFTHVVWKMHGIYMEVAEKKGNFHWYSAQEIEQNAALPTAYRQFWINK